MVVKETKKVFYVTFFSESTYVFYLIVEWLILKPLYKRYMVKNVLLEYFLHKSQIIWHLIILKVVIVMVL